MKPKIIVCGLGRTGYRIFRLLQQQGAAVIGITDKPQMMEKSDRIIIGDMRANSTLMKAGIIEADTLILSSNDDALNLAVLTQARILNPHIRIVNRLYNKTLGDRLDCILPDHHNMSVSSLVAPIFAFAALGNKAIGQLRLYNQTWPTHEEIIDENHPWLGVSLNQLWDNPSRMLIYYFSPNTKVNLVSAVVEGKKLQLGDRLIIGTQPTLRNKRRPKFPKILKAIFNLSRYLEHGRPVATVTIALLLTILLATVTYVSVNFDTPIVDALYFSVGMITGAGGKEEVAEHAPNSIKIFTAIMMIVGAGVIGICYALINDFILGSRIRQMWDAARVPTHNHYIVCGLGAIGMEIVQELHQQGYEVVVIECDPNNRFLHTAWSLGIPIILQDASLASILHAANLSKAEALLAVTSNDMVNVEIALTAKAVVPKLPVIVRCYDSEFANSVQQVFGFEAVLSPTELASHSFAAAALGGKILGNGMSDHLLWVALAIMITPNHPFCSRIVKEAAMMTGFVPLYLERTHHTIHSWQLLEISFKPGDILYLTVPANKLETLWRSQSLSL